jgi:tryptophanyl-tRNA synthetase
MMKKMIEYQEHEELFCFIANYHAMTSVADGKALAKGTIEAAANFLALGMDPEKSTFWVQSDLPEVQELTWFLSTFTPMGLLERCHSYKDKVARGIAANHALFAYPVLMTADILLFHSERVPVGKDQKQHLEVARDIAIKVNNHFGELFVVPEAEIDEEVATVPGLDGQKMARARQYHRPLPRRERAAQAGDAHRHRSDAGGGPERPGQMQRFPDLPAVSHQK